MVILYLKYNLIYRNLINEDLYKITFVKHKTSHLTST